MRYRVLLLCPFVLMALLFPGGVFAEVLINELSPGSDPEWIELYRTDLSDSLEGCTLYLDDNPPSSQIKDLSLESGFEEGNNFYVITWGGSYLNNGGDYVKLDCDGNINDVSYRSEVNPNTYGRYPDGSGQFVILDSATKGAKNTGPVPTATPTPTDAPTPTSTPKPTKTPTPTPTTTPSPTPKAKKATATPTSRPSSTPTPRDPGEKQDLSDLRDELSTPTPEGQVLGKSDSSGPKSLVAGGLVILGGGLVGASVFPFAKKYWSNRQNRNV